MILVLCAQGSDPDTDEGEQQGGIQRRSLAGLDQVLTWLGAEPISKIVVPWPCPGLNPFALVRRLRPAGRVQVVLAGDLPRRIHFWAERNGCETAASTQAALAVEELA